MFAAKCPSDSRICRVWTHDEFLQVPGSCAAHEEPCSGFEHQGLGGPLEGGVAVLLAVHQEDHFVALHHHSKSVPPVGHDGHGEGGRLPGHGGAGLCVVEDDPLVAVLHGRELQAQVDDRLVGVHDGKEDAASVAAGLHDDTDGKIPEEGGRDEDAGRAAHVGTRPEAVGWEAAVAGDKRHRWGQRETNDLHEVHVGLGSRFCREGERGHVSHICSTMLGHKEGTIEVT